MPLGYLFPHEMEKLQFLPFGYLYGLYRYSSRRHFIDYGHVQIPVQCHCQCPRNRRRRHDQYVRRLAGARFLPKSRPLVHAEPVLLVNDCQPEPLEHDIVFDQCVRADDDSRFPGSKVREQCLPLRCLGGSGQYRYFDSCPGKVFADVCKMLSCKHFGRCHYTGLVSVSVCDKRRKDSHHGLSGPHVPLEQPVHLPAAHHVGADLLYHPLLRPCKAVRQCIVTDIERVADFRHRYAVLVPASDVFLFQERKLEEEKFLEFQTVFRLPQGAHVLRKMNVRQCKCQWDKPFLFQYIFGQCFCDGA